LFSSIVGGKRETRFDLKKEGVSPVRVRKRGGKGTKKKNEISRKSKT